MRSVKQVHIVGCHAEGEVGDVIVGGVAPPPGDTIEAMRAWVAEDETLRRFVLNEPRGGVFRHVNLLVPPRHPDADAAFIIMEPEDTPPMSGSNTICVSTVLLDTGILPMSEPETRLSLETPAGLVEVLVDCDGGKARRVSFRNVPAYADRLDASLEVEGIGTITVDTAFGGDYFVITDAGTLGFSLTPDEARDLAETGMRIRAAAAEQLGFSVALGGGQAEISFCQFTKPLIQKDGAFTGRNAVAIRPGKIDRSPTGTGCSARMAALVAKGEMKVGDLYQARSLIGSRFDCRVVEATEIGARPAIIPEISGRAWITSTRIEMLDPDDPWPEGYRLGDTWPLLA